MQCNSPRYAPLLGGERREDLERAVSSPVLLEGQVLCEAAGPYPQQPNSDPLTHALRGCQPPAGGAPAAPAAARLTSWQRMGAYARLLVEPQYASNLAAIVGTTMGVGLLNSGMLTMLASADGATASLPIQALQIFDTVEHLMHGIAITQAHGQRDDEDENKESYEEVLKARDRFSMGIVYCSMADGLCGTMLLAAALGVSNGGLGRTALTCLTAMLRAAQAYKNGRQFGCWSCLKKHLGGEVERHWQQRLNRWIVAVEVIALGLVSDGSSMLSFQGAKVGAKTPEQRMNAGIAIVMAGTFLACAPKILFFQQARTARRTLTQHPPQV